MLLVLHRYNGLGKYLTNINIYNIYNKARSEKF